MLASYVGEEDRMASRAVLSMYASIKDDANVRTALWRSIGFQQALALLPSTTKDESSL